MEENKKCKVCGNPLLKIKGHQRTTFCSKECEVTFSRRNITKGNCPICGKEIQLDWRKRNTKTAYCSQECYKKSRESIKISKICKTCGKEFKVYDIESRRNSNYCSKDCYQKDRNKPIETTCKYCGKDIVIPYTQKKKTISSYCSIDCYNLFRGYNKSAKVWFNNRSRLVNTIEYNIWKVHILDRDNYSCQHCKESLETKDLAVHHKIKLIDIVSKFADPFVRLNSDDFEAIINSKDFKDELNGIVLCKRCHGKLHNSPSIEQSVECTHRIAGNPLEPIALQRN